MAASARRASAAIAGGVPVDSAPQIVACSLSRRCSATCHAILAANGAARSSMSRSIAGAIFSDEGRTTMATTVREMLAAAQAVVPRIAPQEARGLLERGEAVAVDVRDAAELAASGKVAGAVHVPRGMLE